MGFLQRLRWLNTPRAQGSGKLWDNSNSGGVGTGKQGTTVQTSLSVPAQTDAFVPGPNPEPYLKTGEWRSPMRIRPAFDALQPRIPVKQPWAVSSTYVQNGSSAPGQFKNQVPKGSYVGKIKALAPPMTMQRDTLYDAADFARTQRFVFTKTPSQVYFDQKTPLPEFTTPAAWTHAVIAGNNGYFPTSSQSGWEQKFVPESLTPRMNEVGTSPPWLLSTPLNVKQITYSEYDRQRTPIKAVAPKRKRSA